MKNMYATIFTFFHKLIYQEHLFYSEHSLFRTLLFLYNIFFTKSKNLLILLLILLKAFCLLAGYLRKIFTKLIKLHNDAYLQK